MLQTHDKLAFHIQYVSAQNWRVKQAHSIDRARSGHILGLRVLGPFFFFFPFDQKKKKYSQRNNPKESRFEPLWDRGTSRARDPPPFLLIPELNVGSVSMFYDVN